MPALLIGTAGFLWLLWKGPWFLDNAHLNQGTTPGVASVVSGFRTAVVAVGAGAVAGTGLYLSHRTLQLNRPGFGGDSISCKDSSHGTSFLLPT